ncbi:MAG: SLC13 family permease [Polyangia bacterium]|nr:SLC13 family permease [Polyangia bacterium]
MEILVVSLILAAVLLLFVTEWLPVDLTALVTLAALMLVGILPPAAAMAGFANPAPITVGALFIVSQGLVRTGALEFVSERIIRASRGKKGLLLFLLLGLVGLLSAFMNNTPVVVLFTGIVVAACCQFNMSPSKLLIPISFMSILAGTTTLIGTSTNIIVSDLSRELGGRPLGMFELSVLAVPVALAGGAFLYFFSWRLLPGHKEPICEVKEGEHHKYISEIKVPKGSRLVGKDPRVELERVAPRVELYEVLRGAKVVEADEEGLVLEGDDLLLVKASAGDLMGLLDTGLVVSANGDPGGASNPLHEKTMLVELIVPPHSALVGRRLQRTDFTLETGGRLLGVKRRRVHYSAQMLANLRLSVGDILLVECPLDRIDLHRAEGDLIVLEDVTKSVFRRRRAPVAMVIFSAMVALAAFGVLDIAVASLTAACLMVLTGCLSMREAYRSVDVRVLLVIIGTIALGRALQVTGAADLYARGFLSLFSGAGPRVVLAAFIVATSLLSHLLSNNSTAVLLVPIGFSTAAALGVSPHPFVVGIAIGASACFASPIGYQTNLLVYGPGGYRFLDYIRVGMPLNLIVWVSAALLIPVIWPL